MTAYVAALGHVEPILAVIPAGRVLSSWGRLGNKSKEVMDRSVRLLVLTPDFPPRKGGIQLLVHRYVMHLPSFETAVMTLEAVGSATVDRELSAWVRRVRIRRPGGRPAAIVALNGVAVRAAIGLRPDVILNAHTVTAPAAAAIEAICGIPFVQYVHADELLDRPRLSTLSVRRAARVVAGSSYAIDLAIRFGADPDRLDQITPGVDAPREPTTQRSPQPTMLTVSRLADRFKGHDVILRALPAIRSRVPDVRWVVIGDGPLRLEYEQRARELGVDKQVSFAGSVDDDERDRWFDRAHVFVMPSRLNERGGGEGFGISFLEASAHRLPVIAGAVGGALSAVQHDVTGLLIDPEDSVAVADAVLALLLDPDRARRMGLAGERRARQLSWPSAASRLEQVIRSAVGQGDGPR